MSVASFELPLGVVLFCFGIIYGLDNWFYFATNKIVAPTGTIVLSALSVLIGLQFILGFLSYDINSVPKKVLHRKY
jgi:hypothetical protein